MKSYRTVLIIAGSDSIGGAGIQADIKTCSCLGTYAMTAVTAITAQNTCGVSMYRAVDGVMLEAQLDAVVDDVRPDAVKIGMLPTLEAVEVTARFLRRHGLGNVVTDPVCVATSGDALADRSVPEALRELLFPLSAVVTPNIPEAELLTGMDVDMEHPEAVMAALLACGAQSVLLKGGHAVGCGSAGATDFFMARDAGAYERLSAECVDTVNTHGTGCTLSSAIASFLALGRELSESVALAKDYLWHALRAGAGYEFGHGHGPVCHFYRHPDGGKCE